MNNWKVYTAPPTDLDDTTRAIYVIEYADRVKIGRTKHPKSRIRTHYINAEKSGRTIGRIAVKNAENNYYSSESNLHHRFDDRRIENTEEFSVSFEEVISEIHEAVNANISEVDLLKEEIKRLTEELRLAKKNSRGVRLRLDEVL